MEQKTKELKECIKKLEIEIALCKRREKAIHSASKIISSDLSLNKTLDNIVLQITQTLNVSGCTISTWERDQNHLKTLLDYSSITPDTDEPEGKVFPLSSYPKTLNTLETGQTKIIQHDDPNEDKSELTLLSESGIFTLVMSPMIVKNQTIGLLELYEEREPKTYSIEEINLIESLAAQAAIALKNSQLYEKIKSLSLFDPLTGLANRRMMDIQLNDILVKAKRYENNFYILMLDIDYFKEYNDSFGHDAGDNVLKELGVIFKKSIRQSDLIARYGGEEFLIAIADTQRDYVIAVAERIRARIENETTITISIGISYYRKGLKIRKLIREADKALYKAKKQGRNRLILLDSLDAV
ncbi:sensor domain-containing diguanylate cyclase [Desulfobacterales bacterium HSG17]|nr:sensor domain-containing diguanylate cyclase [Desulfobacterales bacterium HSG17]